MLGKRFSATVRLPSVLSLITVMLLAIGIIGERTMFNVAGNEECLHPTTGDCVDDGTPETTCSTDFCEWYDFFHHHNPDHPLWGFFGHWDCPFFSEFYEYKNKKTRTHSLEERDEPGYYFDDWSEPQSCSTLKPCECETTKPFPASHFFDYPAFCGPFGSELSERTARFRVVVGEQDCNLQDY